MRAAGRASVFLAFVSVFCCAQMRLAPVTREEVRQSIAGALRDRGMPGPALGRPEDLDLPLAVPAEAGHRLRVSGVCRDEAAQTTRWRLQCDEQRCLPFFAYIGGAAYAESEERLPFCGEFRPPASPQAAREIVVRPGERVAAMLRSGTLRMTMPVTCLDRGGLGEEIRVRGTGGRVLRATVGAPGLVRVVAP